MSLKQTIPPAGHRTDTASSHQHGTFGLKFLLGLVTLAAPTSCALYNYVDRAGFRKIDAGRYQWPTTSILSEVPDSPNIANLFEKVDPRNCEVSFLVHPGPNQEQITAQELAARLNSVRLVTRFNLSSSSLLRNEDLLPLRQLPLVRSIGIFNAEQLNGGVVEYLNLSSLNEFSSSALSFKATHLITLSKAPELKSLSIERGGIDDETLIALESTDKLFPKLSALSLLGNSCTGTRVAFLVARTKVEDLQLSTSSIPSEEDLRILEELVRMRPNLRIQIYLAAHLHDSSKRIDIVGSARGAPGTFITSAALPNKSREKQIINEHLIPWNDGSRDFSVIRGAAM
jgi:hypothetical protein